MKNLCKEEIGKADHACHGNAQKIRNQILFIVNSINEEHHGRSMVFETRFSKSKLNDISHMTGSTVKQTCDLIGHEIIAYDSFGKAIRLYPLALSREETVLYTEVEISEDFDTVSACFKITGDPQKDHSEIVRLHNWIDRSIKDSSFEVNSPQNPAVE